MSKTSPFNHTGTFPGWIWWECTSTLKKRLRENLRSTKKKGVNKGRILMGYCMRVFSAPLQIQTIDSLLRKGGYKVRALPCHYNSHKCQQGLCIVNRAIAMDLVDKLSMCRARWPQKWGNRFAWSATRARRSLPLTRYRTVHSRIVIFLKWQSWGFCLWFFC
jgi:hypothetical protein